MMGTPKKPNNNKKNTKRDTGAKKPGPANAKPQKRIVEDDDDFEEPLDDLDGYEDFNYDDEDDDDY